YERPSPLSPIYSIILNQMSFADNSVTEKRQCQVRFLYELWRIPDTHNKVVRMGVSRSVARLRLRFEARVVSAILQQRLCQNIGPIGHQAVHAEREQRQHVRAFIHGPDVNVDAEAVGGNNTCARDDAHRAIGVGYLERVIGGAQPASGMRYGGEQKTAHLAGAG